MKVDGRSSLCLCNFILIINFAGENRKISPLESTIIKIIQDHGYVTYAVWFTSKVQWSTLKLFENLEENCDERMHVLSSILCRLNCFTKVGVWVANPNSTFTISKTNMSDPTYELTVGPGRKYWLPYSMSTGSSWYRLEMNRQRRCYMVLAFKLFGWITSYRVMPAPCSNNKPSAEEHPGPVKL